MNEEQIEKAKNAKSAEELLELAKEYGMEMTEEEAADLYDRLHTSAELTDEELENVAGGGCANSFVKVDGVRYRIVNGNTPCFNGHFELAQRGEKNYKHTCFFCTYFNSPGPFFYITDEAKLAKTEYTTGYCEVRL